MRKGQPFPGTWFGGWPGRPFPPPPPWAGWGGPGGGWPGRPFPPPPPWAGWGGPGRYGFEDEPGQGSGFAPWGSGSRRGRGHGRWEGGEVDESARGLFEIFGHLKAAVGQVAHAGNEVQIAEAEQVLTEARRNVYRILSEADPEVPEATAEAPPET
jgi:hypothetical protein